MPPSSVARCPRRSIARERCGGGRAELWRNLGDDVWSKAEYRGGCRQACQNLPKGAIRHAERYHCAFRQPEGYHCAFRQPEGFDDPLTEVAREGARRMLAQVLIAKAYSFVAL